jgi:hypothetical protein
MSPDRREDKRTIKRERVSGGDNIYIVSEGRRVTEGTLKIRQRADRKGVWPFSETGYEVAFQTIAQMHPEDEPPAPGEIVLFEKKNFRSKRAATRAAIKELKGRSLAPTRSSSFDPAEGESRNIDDLPEQDFEKVLERWAEEAKSYQSRTPRGRQTNTNS